MKKLIAIILVAFTLQASAQEDTSKLPVTITLKVKHIEYMAYKLSQSNTLADSRYRDSLIKYIGDGLDSNANVITNFQAGRVFTLVQNLLSEQANVSYSTIYELGNGSAGYTGIVIQLIAKWANVNDPQKLTALWLYNNIAYWLGLGQSIMDGNFKGGLNWLQNPIIQN
jgi:hypothetical protein